MTGHRRSICTFAFIVAFAAGCVEQGNEDAATQSTEDQLYADPVFSRIDCPDVIVRPLSIRSMPDSVFRAGMNRALVSRLGFLPRLENEIHDCQRLINGNSYGPLVTVWVFPALSELGPVGVPKVVAAIVTNGTGPSLPGAQGMVSCLVMQRENVPAGQEDWKAYVVPVTTTTCAGTEQQMSSAYEQNVYSAPEDEDVEHPGEAGPAAARIEDTEEGYVVGLKCGDEWCLVGVASAGVEPRNYRRQKHAWGDEQVLAVKLPADAALRPSGIRARIRAAGNLKNLSLDDFKNGDVVASDGVRYRHVGDIQLLALGAQEEAMHYMTKRFFLPIAAPSRTVRVYMRHETTDSTFRVRHRAWPSGTWSSRELFAKYEPVTGHSGLGTVRFKWSEKDEGSWFQCPNGCCGDDICLTSTCE